MLYIDEPTGHYFEVANMADMDLLPRWTITHAHLIGKYCYVVRGVEGSRYVYDVLPETFKLVEHENPIRQMYATRLLHLASMLVTSPHEGEAKHCNSLLHVLKEMLRVIDLLAGTFEEGVVDLQFKPDLPYKPISYLFNCVALYCADVATYSYTDALDEVYSRTKVALAEVECKIEELGESDAQMADN